MSFIELYDGLRENIYQVIAAMMAFAFLVNAIFYIERRYKNKKKVSLKNKRVSSSKTSTNNSTVAPQRTQVSESNDISSVKAFPISPSIQVVEEQESEGEAAMDQSKTPVLVVESSISARSNLKKILNSHGYQVYTAKDGIDALQIIENNKIDVVVTDLEMPRLDGIGLINQMNDDEDYKKIPIIVITSRDDLIPGVKRMSGVYGAFTKPCNEKDLMRRMNFLLTFGIDKPENQVDFQATEFSQDAIEAAA